MLTTWPNHSDACIAMPGVPRWPQLPGCCWPSPCCSSCSCWAGTRPGKRRSTTSRTSWSSPIHQPPTNSVRKRPRRRRQPRQRHRWRCRHWHSRQPEDRRHHGSMSGCRYRCRSSPPCPSSPPGRRRSSSRNQQLQKHGRRPLRAPARHRRMRSTRPPPRIVDGDQ